MCTAGIGVPLPFFDDVKSVRKESHPLPSTYESVSELFMANLRGEGRRASGVSGRR